MDDYDYFLIECYKQVNEHLRESDRKRDVLVGAFIPLVIGITAFIKDSDFFSKFVSLIGIFLVSIPVVICITRYRGWHAEYVNAAIAINKYFLLKNTGSKKTLMEIAEELKKDKKFYKYFSPGGVEFMMFILAILVASFPLILAHLTLCHHLGASMFSPLSIISLAFILLSFWGLSLYYYRSYLLRRESAFPKSSWCIS
jgi:hypothetical protein